jgi:hypothetical protein
MDIGELFSWSPMDEVDDIMEILEGLANMLYFCIPLRITSYIKDSVLLLCCLLWSHIRNFNLPSRKLLFVFLPYPGYLYVGVRAWVLLTRTVAGVDDS